MVLLSLATGNVTRDGRKVSITAHHKGRLLPLTMTVAEKDVVFLCLCAFGLGVLLGYRLKATKMKYLKWRKDRLSNKLDEIKRQINIESSG